MDLLIDDYPWLGNDEKLLARLHKVVLAQVLKRRTACRKLYKILDARGGMGQYNDGDILVSTLTKSQVTRINGNPLRPNVTHGLMVENSASNRRLLFAWSSSIEEIKAGEAPVPERLEGLLDVLDDIHEECFHIREWEGMKSPFNFLHRGASSDDGYVVSAYRRFREWSLDAIPTLTFDGMHEIQHALDTHAAEPKP